ncbi:MAG: GIY-YIG nuclease family protein [Mesorhizobium sp.]|nr:MAG: GIY-YIG nuclease family protein [Mesorhizobium sp.]
MTLPSSCDVSIYGLVDPRSGEVRYVGKTKGNLHSRLNGHLGDVRRGRVYIPFPSALVAWSKSEEGRAIRSAAGKTRTHSPETREKLSFLSTGKKRSLESRRKQAATRCGAKHSQTTIEKMKATWARKRLDRQKDVDPHESAGISVSSQVADDNRLRSDQAPSLQRSGYPDREDGRSETVMG